MTDSIARPSNGPDDIKNAVLVVLAGKNWENGIASWLTFRVILQNNDVLGELNHEKEFTARDFQFFRNFPLACTPDDEVILYR